MSRSPAARATRFVAESFAPQPAPGDLAFAILRVRRAAAQLPESSGRVRLIRCTMAPSDELCSWWFESDSEVTIRLLGAQVGVDFERIAEAVDIWPAARQPRSGPRR